MVVVEIASPSTAEKYLFESPCDSWNAATMTTVERMPERRLAAIGVPNLAENLPRMRGPAPSYAETASARSAPMSHAAPLEANVSMKPMAAAPPNTDPKPERE